MAGITLHDLVDALASAVVQAQRRIERNQIAILADYFDADNRPVNVDLRLPSLSRTPNAEPETEFSVPLIALVTQTQLAVKDFEVTMDVAFGDLTEVDADDEEPATTETGQPDTPLRRWRARQQRMELDMHARSNERGGTASVTLRVENREPTEGMARVLAELSKRIGVQKQT